jgi:hypothetical protein
VGDFTGDGLNDVAVSKSFGTGEVKVYESTPAAATGPLTLLRSFVPFRAGTGGAAIAAADFGTVTNGRVVDALRQDAKLELVVASGAGMAPVVRVYDVLNSVPAVVDTIRPFSGTASGSLSVTTGRVNVDSIPDIIVSQGRGGSSTVEVYDGRLVRQPIPASPASPPSLIWPPAVLRLSLPASITTATVASIASMSCREGSVRRR